MEAIVAMRWTGLKFCRVGLGALLFVFAANQTTSGQQAAAATTPQTSLTGELASLATRAAVVFAGQVVSTERHGGVVEIVFRVEQNVLGGVGASFTLREWAGLWPQGQFRYTVGERALVFVHAASAAGFASPVDGAEGVVPVVVQGANAPELLDVRRLSAALVRTPGTALATEADGAIQLSEAVAVITAAVQPSASMGHGHLQAPSRLPLPMRGAPVQSPYPSLTEPARNAQPEPRLLLDQAAKTRQIAPVATIREALYAAR